MTGTYVVWQRICMQFQDVVWEFWFDSSLGILTIHRCKGIEYSIQGLSWGNVRYVAAVSTEENGNQSSFKFEVCVAIEIGVGESYPYAFFFKNFFKNRLS